KVEDNPWEIMRRDYPVGTVCKAKVVGMTTFGAFANVIPGIDGLIHISQIADRRINKPEDVLTIGEEVDVKVTEIDFDKKRVSLSIRALIEPVAEEAAEEAVEAATEEAAEEAAE
ncbi:MAG: S1 RNA-binding domain-containing protein, partial [Clostridia bacterium]|nr:S1 RNA-binding domain-containing protein [Clostridia bacterium]